MPTFIFTSPDGRSHEVSSDDPNATPEQAAEQLKIHLATPHGMERVKQDLVDAPVEGVAGALQQLAGTLGDVQKMAGIPRSGRLMPTSEDVGNTVSQISRMVGGPTSLPELTAPEAPFIKNAVQGAASMTSGRPMQLLLGTAAGIGGELASRYLDQKVDPSSPTSTGDSAWRTAGELPFLAMALAGNLRRPPNVKALLPGLKTMGETPVDISNAIDRASARANIASDQLKGPVPLWTQLPELAPEIKDLRATRQGAPLNAQAAALPDAISTEIRFHGMDPSKPVWDPQQGWINPSQAMAGGVGMAENTATPRGSSLGAGANAGMGKHAWAALDILKWPEKAASVMSGLAARMHSNRVLSDIAQSLSGPGAADFLKEITNYSPMKNSAQALARALLAAQMGAGQADPVASQLQ